MPMIRQILFIATSLLAAAQPPGPTMSVPSLGYLFDDNAKAIRLVSGVPGAASMDAAVAANITLDSAFVNSRGRIAVANTKDGNVAVIQWSGSPQGTTIATSLGRITLAAFSRPGDRVAITDGTGVEVWSGLGGSAQKVAAFAPDSSVTALAMSDDGSVAAATASGAVLLLGDATRVLASGGNWTALAFLPNGGGLLAADGAAQNLVLIDVQGDGGSSIFLSIGQPTGALGVAADGTWAALAVAGDILLVNLTTGESQPVSCACHITRFDPLEGNLVLHMVDAGTGGLLMLDADSSPPRIASMPELNLGGAQ
jgi:hypothetical protein